MEQVHVLLVEDSATDAKLVVLELERSGRTIASQRVQTRVEMQTALETRSWDLVVSDWALPQFSALGAIELLKQLNLDVPLLVVTGTVGEEYAVVAMRAGAQDYVLKDSLTRLVPAMERELREREARVAHRGAAQAQREAELRFRRIFDSGITGITIADMSGRIIEANGTFLESVGYTRDDLEAGRLSWIELTPLEWRDTAATVREQLDERGSTRPFEKEYVRKDGSRVPVLVGVALLDENCVLTIVTDLTAQKRVEMALVQRMRVAALGADVGMALTGAGTPAEVLQRCCEAIVKHLDAALARIWTLDATFEVLELKASAGNSTRLDGQDARIQLGEGEIGSVARERSVHVIDDVGADPRSDREWAEREGFRSFAGHPLLVNSELIGVLAVFGRETFPDVVLAGLSSIADVIAVRIRGRIAEQAATALEEQLRQAQKMEAVGRLAGGVAHDFNNMLSVILSYSELVSLELKQGDPMLDDVQEIHRAGVRASDLTRQLLMFSRQQVIESKVLDLNLLLADMDKMLRRLVGEDIELRSVAGVALGRVDVDPGSIEQVVMNLAINASDAMDTGGKLTMETANVILDDEYVKSHLGAKPGPYVMLSVTDTGAGMDRATQARIFEPFFTTKEKGKGTGLGLSTVFGIVQQSRGNIWVYSEIGVGTTFKIYFPRVDAVLDEVRPQRLPTSLRGSETILLVEDEVQVRQVASGILRKHGYTVIEGATPGEALLTCERHSGKIDLLLTDVVMPQMSGLELAKRLGLGRPHMKVLCMSGYTDESAVRHGVIDSAVPYLQKPITVDALTRKVRDVLDSSAG